MAYQHKDVSARGTAVSQTLRQEQKAPAEAPPAAAHAEPFSAEDIQAGVASLLRELILLYTGGDGSSIREETASDILGSIRYALGAACGASAGDLPALLRENGVRPVYKKGLKAVRACLGRTRALYRQVSAERLELPLRCYTDTLDTAVPRFLSSYDPVFRAQKTAAAIDYPVVFDDASVTGIFYLLQYLQKLRLETEFCRCFPQRSVLRALYGFGETFSLDIVNTPVSIFEILFDQTAFALFGGAEAPEPEPLSPDRLRRAERALAGKTPAQTEALAVSAADACASSFHLRAPLKSYLRRYAGQLAARLVSTGGSLRHTAILERGTSPDEASSGAVLRDGERLNDFQFGRVVDEVLACEDTPGKVALILQNIHSSRDAVDLLQADCLYGEEFTALFRAMGDTELAALGKSVFPAAGGPGRAELRLTPAVLEDARRSARWEWQQRYVDYLAQMEQARRSAVGRLIGSLVVRRPEDFREEDLE